MQFEKKQKPMILSALILFLLANVFVALPVGAQGYPVFDSAAFTQNQVFHTGETMEKVQEKSEAKVKDELWKTMVLTASVTLRNIALYLAKSAAESAVEMISAGDWGKGPMFETQGWGDMLKNEYEYAAGNVLEYISEGVYSTLGFDICAPKLDFKIWLTASLGEEHDLMHQTLPYCAPTQVLNNWDSFAEEWKTKFKDPQAASLAALDTVAMAFAPTSSPFGLFLTFNDQILFQAQKTQDAETLARLEGGGWKAVTNQIGTKYASPVSVSRGMAERDIVRAESSTDSSYEVALGVIEEIPQQMLSSFVNTLMSRGILESIRKAILRGFASASESYNPKEKVYETEKGTEQAILALKTVNVSYSYKEINLLEDFAVCPDMSAGGENIPSINNCVIDDKFHDAVAAAAGGKAMTVQDAIDLKYLNPALPLIGPSDERNLQRRCFEQGYCYGNLVKLRKARILPVGWEMAAQISETKGAPVTLGQAVAAFYDANSAWYHMVDPNWVLSAPLQRCRIQGYNDMLYAKGGDARQEVCVDTQDCVRVDENGKCVGGWGYCRAEENIWQLNGDSCPGYYDSCLTLTRRDGKTFDYLKNTLVENSLLCNENNVGCKWYSMWKDGSNWIDSKDQRLLANAKLTEETCQPSAEGCLKFFQTTPGNGINILPNADFEDVDPAGVDALPGWQKDGGKSTLILSKDFVYSGENSVKVTVPANNTNWEGLQTGDVDGAVLRIAPQAIPRFFAFSGYIYIDSDISGTWKLEPHYIGGGSNFAGKQRGGDFTWDNSTTKNQWIRKYVIIETDPYVSGLRLAFTTNKGSGTVYVDAAMIEEIDPLSGGFVASTFAQYGEAALNLKKAPEYYKCYNVKDDKGLELTSAYGTPNSRKNIKIDDDAKSCEKFASTCAADEVGCEQFTNKETGEVIYGSPSYYDYCPSTCKGYDVYEQTATSFETGAFPFYMIPAQAQTCSETAAGCDEFTNLDVVEKGGEGKEYYSELRMCHKPVPNIQGDEKCAPFYTWTGSDSAGYQLLSYNLQDSNQNGDPDTTMNDSEFCNATIYAENLAAQKVSNCREFYSKDGKKTYHLYTKTITCSTDCHPYRRTLASESNCSYSGGSWENGACLYMAIPNEGQVCSKSNAGCREFKGSQSGNIQAVFKSTFEQQQKGNEKSGAEICAVGTHYNVTSKDDKTSITVSGISWDANKNICKIKDGDSLVDVPFNELCGWRGFVWDNGKCFDPGTLIMGFADWDGGKVSAEAVYSGGHSLLLDTNVNSTKTDLTGKVLSGVGYRLSLWAKKETTNKDSLKVNILAGGSVESSVSIALQNDKDWHFYNIIGFYMPKDASSITLEIAKQFDASSKLYLDDIKLYTVADTYYLLKQSAGATVPAACNQKLDGAVLPQAMIGCSEYSDTVGGTHFLKSFTKLCVADAVGCEALIDTGNSLSPFAETFFQGAPQTGIGAKQYTQTDLENFCKNDATVLKKVQQKYPNISKLNWCAPTGQGVSLGTCQSIPCGAPGTGTVFTSKDFCALTGNWWDADKKECWKASAGVTVSADKLIYLVNSKQAQCSKDAVGCTALGMPNLQADGTVKPITDKSKCDKISGIWDAAAGVCKKDANSLAPSWSEVYYIVDPDNFKTTLCQYGGMGCESFSSGEKGQTYYLFDPGEQVCEYKTVEQTAVDGTVTSVTGWWRKYEKTADGQPVKCASGDYYNDGTQNLLRANDVAFTGWVGVCKNKSNKCTAFVDPTDKSTNDFGRAYYYLNNDALDSKSCGGVSQFKGCVLFNNTSNVNLSWASELTYADSKANGGAKVNPTIATAKKFENKDLCPQYTQCVTGQNVDGSQLPIEQVSGFLYKDLYAKGTVGSDNFQQIANNCTKFESDSEKRQCLCTAKITLDEKACNIGQVLNEIAKENQTPDSNVILKVVRDRQCKEWYTCAGGHWEWVAQRQQYEKKCDVLGLCDRLVDGTEVCSNMDIYNNNTDYNAVSVFGQKAYQSRSTDFDGIEYSGYMIPGTYPLYSLKSVNVNADASEDAVKESRLAFVGPSCAPNIKPCPAGFTCSGDKVCVKNIDNTPVVGKFAGEELACRAYPEENSPFPGAILDLYGSDKTDFLGANICLDKDGCGCNYQKVTYGSKSREIYMKHPSELTFSSSEKKPKLSDKPFSICEKDYNGRVMMCEMDCNPMLGKNMTVCSPKENANTFKYADNNKKIDDNSSAVELAEACGQCLKLDKDTNVFKGWDGYCLEKDSSNIINGKQKQNPCLSWYPVDVVGGTLDLNNYSPSAGYVPPTNSENYCVESALFKYPSAFVPDKCINLFLSTVSGDEDCNCKGQNYFKFFKALESPTDPNVKSAKLFDYGFEDALWDYMEPQADSDAVDLLWGGGCFTKEGNFNARIERARCMYEYLQQDYVEDKKSDKDKSEVCPSGYFPTFGSCGNNKSVSGYSCGDDLGPQCGFMCVPYGSHLYITEQRIIDFGDTANKEDLLGLAEKYNGKECFPGLYFKDPKPDAPGDVTESEIRDAVSGISGFSGNKDRKGFFSMLYVPYKYCQSPGVIVDSGEYDYLSSSQEFAVSQYVDVFSDMNEFPWSSFTGKENSSLDYGLGCAAAAEVSKTVKTEPLPQTKAWTDRLWQTKGWSFNKDLQSVGTNFQFWYATYTAPFGKVSADLQLKTGDDVRVTYCASANKLSLPTGYDKSGTAKCAGQIYATDSQHAASVLEGKSYGAIVATAPKSISCGKNEDCYVYAEGDDAQKTKYGGLCSREELEAAPACEKVGNTVNAKTYWLWRDGCYNVGDNNGEPLTSSNCVSFNPTVDNYNAVKGSNVTFVGYRNGSIEYWRENSAAYNQDGTAKVGVAKYIKAEPFNGNCTEHELCHMHALVNGSTLECDTPDNWAKNYPNALNKNDLGSTFRPGLGCKSGKTPNDADNECNLGSHIIVCADSNFAKISTGEQKVVVDSSPQLVKGKKIEGKTYISSQNLVTWLGQAISTLTPNFNDFYCKEDGTLVQPYAFGKCLGGADTVCARHSDCEIYACSTGKCALKEFAGTGVSVKTIEGYGEKLANKPSFKDRLSNLFQAVYKLYEWSIGTIKLADYKYTANPIIGEVSIKSAMIDIGDKITWEGNSGADFSGDLSKSGTIPPVVSGHIKSQSGSDVALLNTITVKTSVGSYLTGDVVGRNGILGAQIEFYAWADKDHMPLRQVMVDFGSQQDIIGAANENQRYMNHKPTCGGADGVIGECAGYEGLVCTSNSECDLATGGKSKLCNQVQSFGNSANACFSGYFSYFGMYQCKNKQMNTLPACPGGAKILDSADYIANHPSYSKGCWDADYYDEELNAQTGACIYFPRVQVKDNWEWCNGKCAGQSDKGCFMSNCQQDKYSTSINPWTYFKGKVLVTP